MNDEPNLTTIHGRTTEPRTVHILWAEDFWQKGDPMFTATDSLHRTGADRNRGADDIAPKLRVPPGGFQQ